MCTDGAARKESLDENQLGPDTERGEHDTDVDAKKKILVAGLQEMRCLLSFIDNCINKKRDYLASDRCQYVAFADLALLYVPGDFVVSKDGKQAYRVINVASTRHRVRNRDEGGLDFWEDETIAQYDASPIFVYCIHVDFDGISIGPVSTVFAFSRFSGKLEISSLRIYPLRRCNQHGMRERLIKRGKTFLEMCGIKHMHYTGLSLGDRDEIDSQVVIDFEETIDRYPDWAPNVKQAIHASLHDLVDSAGVPLVEDAVDEFINVCLRSREQRCVKECCASEVIYRDEYLERQTMEEIIAAQHNRKLSAMPSVAVVPRIFKDIGDSAPWTDDDFLIMSYRVFGFVLRSRNWGKYRHFLQHLLGDGFF